MAIYNEHLTAFFGVTTGWTGEVRLARAPFADLVVTPTGRNSCGSVWLALLRLAHATFAWETFVFEGWLTSNVRLLLQSSTTFTISGTGTTWSRLGGVGSPAATDSIELTNRPDACLLGEAMTIRGSNGSWTGGISTAMGNGVNPIMNNGGTATLRVMEHLSDGFADESTYESEGDPNVIDVWTGGFEWGRYTIQGIARSPTDLTRRRAIWSFSLAGSYR